MTVWALQFVLGLLVANMGEWFIHRYCLHGLGQRKDSFWAYHLYEHHAVVLRNNMLDTGYQKWPIHWNSQAKELLVLVCILLLNLPFFWWLNGYACAIYFSVVIYYLLHRQAHCNQGWAKTYLPWHYHHHMTNDEADWCISHPLFDYLMKTRSK
ncbi:conserved hypothetical protein [Bathymodiolus platifrons methanotrophic gill symbiont]|uniref:sterol desaturase family protein n=1 Tax=Bathymodiolus platifrons methanotrophic gill symbiont TaxID=113268 RepID=UPI000B410B13|nr:sterol desaturase family protein [Bathymodiolus platifrons methanotrophic gill symbiont]MCK5869589.1 sterol desaturase family protein [Methyloprofundus sp.]TXK99273.1 hypothetical protein BMR10_00920 [Methylococcaceae bacterium CS4]TXL00679.1 hypothetical protein BMR11_02365 [Methylococcaceae bacterium CS5]TXL03382.1 hypothetical protein BMR07_15395 [Methylococcaceae bacterium CS1]TXL09355.1 hypothetical protein BMR09_00990 [Methylococcaceae bacterium CS3]TXL12030.1 hypothetical protein BM